MTKKYSKNWYELNIESPLKGLVKLLRDNGFNTTCSCGHLPNPYIQMDWSQDSDITRLHNLLWENDYKNFVITARLDTVDKWSKKSFQCRRTLHLTFYFKLPYALIEDIRRVKEK